MASTAFFAKLRNALQRFRSQQGGNVVITFALATVPIMGFVGSAVDFSRANSAKAAMQAAIDAAALMISKDVASLTPAQVNQKTLDYFNANFNRTEVNNVVITPVYTTTGGSQIVVNGSGTLNTTFMKVMGVQQMNLSVSATIKWGNTRLRVALVLDNTGSMADSGKMPALITATKNLLDQLKNAAANNGDVYVSIIPFVKDVNVGASNYAATWIDWTEWNAANGSNQCSIAGKTSQRRCNNAGGTWSWVPANHNTWNGCVTDRGNSNAPSSGNYDTNVAAPVTTNTATLFSAEQYSSCPQAVKPLSYDWAAMKTLVNNMSPNGNTNQAIGLAHGWLSLVGGGPYPAPPAMDPNYQYTQVIILLTDGLNTQDRWYSCPSNGPCPTIDARQQLTCNNVNAAGITLYTVQVNTGGDPTSTLLQNCAGSPGKYPDSSKFFLLTSASAIVTTFNQIGTALSNLRVAK